MGRRAQSHAYSIKRRVDAMHVEKDGEDNVDGGNVFLMLAGDILSKMLEWENSSISLKRLTTIDSNQLTDIADWELKAFLAQHFVNGFLGLSQYSCRSVLELWAGGYDGAKGSVLSIQRYKYILKHIKGYSSVDHPNIWDTVQHAREFEYDAFAKSVGVFFTGSVLLSLADERSYPRPSELEHSEDDARSFKSDAIACAMFHSVMIVRFHERGYKQNREVQECLERLTMSHTLFKAIIDIVFM
ncbi:hypothetical protein SARC_07514 [Sphaeroforma arctica JP610]|uniref:Uncharacterized protein n=1 Tax=Sphaeroforma arctica JP610 TaxID=667725 RepID=A0A0L0FTZ0_9EUKA|nr:hypothetical protein SARC_07514 [Sphaeroforma arctica JP610]KNC80114.1 hypothetical protein SARC_07514 [Sphaeroforma arctica JP610]|eukprot:XP_014154016.1 hypothetical protein SARC_07514 [Sphaeroforma arctica JP610]